MSATPLPVEEPAFRDALAGLQQLPLDERLGLFEADAIFREVNRHTVVYFLGAVQSVQMQLCHPWVATAVFEHSKIMSNPRRRAQLTYIYLWSLIYGDRDMVAKKAGALYRVHARVQGNLGTPAGNHAAGSHYQANEAHALLWVHVTAFLCRVRLYERLVRPLSPAERDRFVQEAQRYAACFGIPPALHPQDWQQVEDYVAAVSASDTLAATDAGLQIRHFLERSIPAPLRGALWNFLCMDLPPRLQAMLAQPRSTPENLARAAGTEKWLRLLQRRLPAKLRYVPAWHEMQRRLAGKAGPDWVTAKLNTLVLGLPRLVS